MNHVVFLALQRESRVSTVKLQFENENKPQQFRKEASPVLPGPLPRAPQAALPEFDLKSTKNFNRSISLYGCLQPIGTREVRPAGKSRASYAVVVQALSRVRLFATP